MRQKKIIKLGIGCLLIIMMLGTALFSVQAFTGKFQSDAFSSSKDSSINKSLNNNIKDSESGSPETNPSSSSTATPIAHSMDSSPESNGFLAVPWIPVSFIRQSMKEASLLQQEQKFLRIFIIRPYPSDKKMEVTDRTIQNQTNSLCLLQTLDFHISRLTAG